jgi:hypothetical protein
MEEQQTFLNCKITVFILLDCCVLKKTEQTNDKQLPQEICIEIYSLVTILKINFTLVQ